MIPRAIDGTFLPGYRPPAAGVGRTKGSLGGRAKALLLLDKIVGEECVQAAIAKAMRDSVLADPMKFFRQVIMPLLPQDVKVKLGEEGAIRVAPRRESKFRLDAIVEIDPSHIHVPEVNRYNHFGDS